MLTDVSGLTDYMAPELLAAGVSFQSGTYALVENPQWPVRKGADFWAAGIVLYRLACGRHPFHRGDREGRKQWVLDRVVGGFSSPSTLQHVFLIEGTAATAHQRP